MLEYLISMGADINSINDSHIRQYIDNLPPLKKKRAKSGKDERLNYVLNNRVSKSFSPII